MKNRMAWFDRQLLNAALPASGRLFHGLGWWAANSTAMSRKRHSPLHEAHYRRVVSVHDLFGLLARPPYLLRYGKLFTSAIHSPRLEIDSA